MLENLKGFALQKLYAIAVRKGVDCPQCDKRLDLPAKLPAGGLDAEFSCDKCDWSGSLTDFISEGRNDSDAGIAEKPTDSRIIESNKQGGKSWLIPARKRPNFLWFFSAFWLVITGFVSVAMVAGEIEGDNLGALAYLFMLPFWAVGIGTAYWGLRMSFLEVIVVVKEDQLILLKKVFGKVKQQSLQFDQIGHIELDVAYKQNERPVYQLKVHALAGALDQGGEKCKALKFGTNLKHDEKRWMITQLENACQPAKSLAAGSVDRQSAGTQTPVNELQTITTKGLKLDRVTAEGFRLTRQHRYGVWCVIGGLIGLIVSVAVGRGALNDLTNLGEGAMNIVALIFALIPSVISLVFGLLGLASIVFGLKASGRVQVFEFQPDKLQLKEQKRGETLKKESYPREIFTKVKVRSAGEVNGQPRFKVVLQAKGKSIKLCGFESREVASSLEDWVAGWIPPASTQQSQPYAQPIDVA